MVDYRKEAAKLALAMTGQLDHMERGYYTPKAEACADKDCDECPVEKACDTLHGVRLTLENAIKVYEAAKAKIEADPFEPVPTVDARAVEVVDTGAENAI